MKKFLWAALLALSCLGARAQDFRIEVAPDVPEAAQALLVQRFTQMLEGGGFSVWTPSAEAPEAPEGLRTISVAYEIASRMDTPGSLSQVALGIQLTATVEDIVQTFSIKGVGDDYGDAWLRAVKQLLPRSREAQAFIQRLKF
jgi:hypothetical protein